MPRIIAHMLALVLSAVSAGSFGVSASEVFSSPWSYDWGLFGLHPQTWYKSFGLASPLLNYLQWDDQCDDGGLYLMSPRGSKVPKPGPVITDARGNLVWTAANYGEITDFKMQTYHGSQYLTFWAGENAESHRYGSGMYYMLNDAYEIHRTFQPVGEGLRGDLHEFRITENGSALMTVYQHIPWDLSPLGGPADGWLLDSLFQEVDIETGALVFEWRSSDHIPVQDTMRAFKGGDLGDKPDHGFDYFHINSIDKDDDGNYVVSGRHSHQVIKISASSGEVLWILGGKHNMFEDLSGGRATDFWWQHHARCRGNNTLSLFDNAKSETGDKKYYGHYSRGMLLQLDTEEMTVELLQEYADPNHQTLSQSQGSMQMLENGKVVLAYGFAPTFSEFSSDGRLLCETRIAPWLIWRLGLVTTYRTFKTTSWVGRPTDSPSIYLHPSEGVVYVSWNGATEVDRWVLEGASWEEVKDGNWTDCDEQEKDGFEAAFDITESMPQYLRVAALDGAGEVLGHTAILDRSKGNAKSLALHDLLLIIFGGIIGVMTVLAGVFWRRWIWLCRKRPGYNLIASDGKQRRRNVSKAHELQPLYDDREVSDDEEGPLNSHLEEEAPS